MRAKSSHILCQYTTRIVFRPLTNILLLGNFLSSDPIVQITLSTLFLLSWAIKPYLKYLIAIIIQSSQVHIPLTSSHYQVCHSNILICGRNICFSQCFIAVKRHHDHGNSYKREYLIGTCIHSQRFNLFSSWQEKCWEAGRHILKKLLRVLHVNLQAAGR